MATESHLASSGIAGLDELLGGGFPRRRIYLVQGAPGSGKTTLGLQFLLEGKARGERGLYVTLSETREELQAVADSHGWSLDGVEVHQLASPEEMLYAQRQNTVFHPAEVELNETVSRVLTLIDRVRPSRVVFDSLSELRLLAGDSLRYRRQILALKQQFAGRDGTVLFLDDGTGESSGDEQLQSLAHGVVGLAKSSPEYGAARRRLEIVKMRGVNFRTGFHDYTIVKSGLRVFPRLVAAEHHSDFKQEPMKSGVPDLDQLLGGGLDRGASSLFLGPAGSGKSSCIAQYVDAALKRNERVVVFSFDETVKTFITRTTGLGFRFADAAAEGQLVVRQIDPAELSPGEFTAEVRRMVEGAETRMVVIDSLNGYLMAMPDERHLVIQMHELLTYLSQKGVATLLVVAQHGLVGTMQAPIDVTYLADAVVLFRFFEAAGRVHKALSVVKKRTGSHEDTIRELRITATGIQIGAPLTEFRGVLTGTPSFVGQANALIWEK